MPVWHEATRKLVAEGKLVVIGVAQEQHPDRCRLFLQWHGIDWPMMHDPITRLGLTAVPVVTAIDEHGVVRLTRPDPETLGREFVERRFEPPARSPVRPGKAASGIEGFAGLSGDDARKATAALRARAEQTRSAAAWREYGDAALLWGGAAGVAAALEAYPRAIQVDLSSARGEADSGDGLDAWLPRVRELPPTRQKEVAATLFRLGVAYRMRVDSAARREGEFQAALDHWSAALALDPNQYIWRRRIEQYGPRLEKPYPFYDWIEEARAAIRARGETPIALAAEPTGAEIAAPLRALAPAAAAVEPDPDGRILHDTGELIRVEAAIAPGRVCAGAPVRLHLVFRPVEGRQAHWNNEGQPPQVWLRAPEGWETERRLMELPQPRTATSNETREASIELRAPAGVRPGATELTGYALYNVCEGASGTCLFRRQEFKVRVPITGE